MSVIRSMVLPLYERQVLLPNVALVEVISYKEPKLHKIMPDWFLGMLAWRGMDIPMVCLENFESGLKPIITPKATIGVFNMIEVSSSFDDSYPFMAILLQGFPRLSRVSNSDLKFVKEHKRAVFKLEITLRGNNMYIIELGKLQTEIMEQLLGKGLT